MTRIASHRGGTLEFGDSTPAGFTATARMALEEVEFDVHPTADGAIVVHHDPTLDATTDTTGAIIDMTLKEVKAATIRYSAAGHPMTLEELCVIYEDSALDFRCEIKPNADGFAYDGFVERVVATLDRCSMLQRTTFSSFLIPSLDELQRASTRPRLWLVSPPVLRQLGSDAVIETAIKHDIPEIGVHIDTADREVMSKIQHAGLHFGCWAAHTRMQINKALDLEVKVFTTDRPTLAIAVRADRNGGLSS